MAFADGDREAADELLERARTDPASVEATELVEALTSEDRRTRQRAARAYTQATRANPGLVDDVANGLRSCLGREDNAGRNAAALTIAQLADRHPDAYGEAVAPLLEIVRREFDYARNNSLVALAELASERPDAVCRGLPALIELLDEDLVGRVRALQVLTPLSERRPEAVGDHLGDVLKRISEAESSPVSETGRETAPFQGADRENESALSYTQWNHIGRVVGNVARGDRGAFDERVDTFRSHLADDSPGVRSVAVHVLSVAAPRAPAAVAPLAEELLRVVTDDQPPETRFRASLALCGVGIEAPERVTDVVVDALPEFDRLLEAEDPRLKGAAVGLFGTVAEDDPTIVADRAERIRPLLDDDIAYVRANAALVAGHVGDDDALPTLRTMAAEDADEEVRRAATQAVSQVDAAETEE